MPHPDTIPQPHPSKSHGPRKEKPAEALTRLRRKLRSTEAAELNATAMARDWAASGSVLWQQACLAKQALFAGQAAAIRAQLKELEPCP